MSQTVNNFVPHFTPRALNFATLCSLIYGVPVLYALTANLSLLADYTLLWLLFFVTYFLLYFVWYANKGANLAGDKVQLLFYQSVGFLIVLLTAFGLGVMRPDVQTADAFFFGYVALPTLYGSLAVINYALFVWALGIL